MIIHALKIPNGVCYALMMQLGAKKGLGAQKVSSKSFSEVEKQAQVAEKIREEQASEAKKQAEDSMWVSPRTSGVKGLGSWRQKSSNFKTVQ